MLSGRTSIVVDPTFHKRLYSLAGYKIVGPRAVRIDILERLVNLIRTLTQWEPQAGPHINGAYGEKKFYITLEMLSILGTNLDDMVQILQALSCDNEIYSKLIVVLVIFVSNYLVLSIMLVKFALVSEF